MLSPQNLPDIVDQQELQQARVAELMKVNNAQHKFVVKNQQFHLPETKEKFIPITEEQVKIIEPKQKITEPKSKPTEPRSKSPKKAVGLTKNKSNKKIKMA